MGRDAGNVGADGRGRGRGEVLLALFDFDGTLCDTEILGIGLDRPVYASFGISPTEEEMRSLCGTDGEESVPALFARYGMDVSADEFYARREPSDVIYERMPLEPMPGARELLGRLAARGIACGVVSTTRHDLVETALRRIGLAGSFAFVVGGDDVSTHKPDPMPYLRGIELGAHELGIGANGLAARTVVVEDSPSGVASGLAAGCYVYGFTGNSTPQDVGAADEVVSSLDLVLA